MSVEISNCVFSYKCPKLWDLLQRTNDPNVRYCDSCKEKVWLCVTDKALKAAIKQKNCVAIEFPGDMLKTVVSVGRVERYLEQEVNWDTISFLKKNGSIM